jgi:hypothetical protein
VTRSAFNLTTEVAERTLDCGHVLRYPIAPPCVDDTVMCPTCDARTSVRRVIDGPRRTKNTLATSDLVSQPLRMVKAGGVRRAG